MEDFIHNKFGYCYYEISKNSALIYNLYVHAEYRNKGNAKHLLQLAINEIRYVGYTESINIQCIPFDDGIDTERLSLLYKTFGLNII